MKQQFTFLLLLLVSVFGTPCYTTAQTISCPVLSTNSPTVTCTTPCVTLNANVTPNLNATTTYAVSSIPYTPYSYTAGTSVVLPGTLIDDIYSTVVTMPFNFCFMGSSYNQMVVGANANISFDVTLAGATDPYQVTAIPTASYTDAHRNAIMGSWTDYEPQTSISGWTIKYATYGTAPCRVFVVSFYNLPLFLCNTMRGTQQIVLYESTNIIEIYTQSKPYCSSWTYDGCVTGIENASGSLQYTAPGENGTVVTLGNEAWRFTPTGASSPWTYTWTGPGGAVVGSGPSVSVCPTVTSTYVVTAVSTACSGVSLTQAVTVPVVSIVGPITGTPNTCVGHTSALADTSLGGVWSSSNPSIASVSSTGVVTGISAGTVVISYTISTSGTSCSRTLTFTVNNAPPLTGTLSACIGNTATLADAVTGGTFISSNTGVATVGLTSGIVTAVSTGTSIITYTTPPGCVTTSVFTANPLPANIGGSATVCQGLTVPLTDSTTGGSWTSSNTGIATISSTGVVTGVSAGTAVITYMLPTSCFKTQVITVNPLLPISGTSAMCLGNSVSLSDAVAGGTWSINPASVATINSSGVVSSVAPGTATVTYTTPAGCVANYVVSVNPLPSNIAGPPVVCQGYTIALSDSMAGGSWVSGSPGVATVSSAGGIVTGVSAGTAVITYIMPTGCYKTRLVTVTASPAPIGGPNRVCATFGITLTDATSGGYFSSSNTAVATIDSVTGVLHGVSAGTATITYTTAAAGCFVTRNVTVYALPAAPLTSDLIYCQHSSLGGVYPPLTAVSAAGGTLVWYPDSTTTASIPTPTPSNTPGVHTWYVSQIVNQCESPDRDKITVTVHAQATRPYINPGKPYACQYDTLSMHYSYAPFPGEQFWWSLPLFDTFATGYNATQPSVIAVFDTSIGMNIVTLTTSDGYHPCDVVDSLPVIVHEITHADFYANHDVCMGDTVTVALTYISNNVSDYTWDFGTDYTMISASSNHGGPYKMTWSDSGVHVLTLNAFDGFGCPPHTVYDTVLVHPTPDARIAPPISATQDGHICWGDSVLFAPYVYDYHDIYTWTPEHFFHQDNSYNIWGLVERPLYVTMRVTDPFGCWAEDSVLVSGQYCCSVVFPNAFTPNGDHKNDVFRPVTQGHHKIHTFRIANRWGVQVFESNNIDGAWDGTFNGEPQDMGVYYYYIKYDCDGRTIEEKGEVTLIR